VKVRAKKKVRLGKDLKIGWKLKLPGGRKNVAMYDAWISRDDGATFPELIATGLLGAAHSLKWTATGAATDQAVVKVVAWTKALQRAEGTSRTLRIVP
jgi:IS5 family transposase